MQGLAGRHCHDASELCICIHAMKLVALIVKLAMHFDFATHSALQVVMQVTPEAAGMAAGGQG